MHRSENFPKKILSGIQGQIGVAPATQILLGIYASDFYHKLCPCSVFFPGDMKHVTTCMSHFKYVSMSHNAVVHMENMYYIMNQNGVAVYL